MNVEEKIIKNYPLVDKIDCELNCYYLNERRYLVFWDELINKNNIMQVLDYLENKTDNLNFSENRTLIVVGKTTDKYEKTELCYYKITDKYYGYNTILIVFYLIDEELNKIYMEDHWISYLELSYKKYVRKIDKIVRRE